MGVLPWLFFFFFFFGKSLLLYAGQALPPPR